MLIVSITLLPSSANSQRELRRGLHQLPLSVQSFKKEQHYFHKNKSGTGCMGRAEAVAYTVHTALLRVESVLHCKQFHRYKDAL